MLTVEENFDLNSLRKETLLSHINALEDCKRILLRNQVSTYDNTSIGICILTNLQDNMKLELEALNGSSS